MKKSDAFLLNQSFVILSFVCSLNGKERLGVVVAILSILFSQYSLSNHVLKNDWLKIGMISFVELLIFELSGLTYFYSSLYFLSLSSLIVAFTWNHAGYKAKAYGMKWMAIVGGLFLFTSLVAPYQKFGFFNTLYVVVVIFLPSNFMYFVKQYRFIHLHKNRNVKMSVVK